MFSLTGVEAGDWVPEGAQRRVGTESVVLLLCVGTPVRFRGVGSKQMRGTMVEWEPVRKTGSLHVCSIPLVNLFVRILSLGMSKTFTRVPMNSFI